MKATFHALVAMAALSTGALASSFGHLSRMDDAEGAFAAAISNDSCVKGFGLAAGLIPFQSESGGGNGQMNQAALATVDAHAVFASAQVLTRQAPTGNTTTLAGIFAGNNAARGDAMLHGATGDVGVNIAAGASRCETCQGLPISTAVGIGLTPDAPKYTVALRFPYTF